MVASDSNVPLLEGLRRLLRNQWFVAIAILVTAMAVRWEFHLWNPHPSGFFIYHGSPISDGFSYSLERYEHFHQITGRPLSIWTGLSAKKLWSL
jgi:hypothetical protein